MKTTFAVGSSRCFTSRAKVTIGDTTGARNGSTPGKCFST